MIVVIVVSRRVGQVTLLVSERTSCRNLNGLKAIVFVSSPLARRLQRVKESEQPSSAQPSVSRDERQAGSIVRGIQSRAGYPSKRAGSRWRLCTACAAKGQGMGQPKGLALCRGRLQRSAVRSIG